METKIIKDERDYQLFKEIEKYKALLEVYTENSNELNNLKTEHEKLKEEFEQLKEEHEQLKYEYSENTIVESMNNMKVQYEELMQTTVPQYKYDRLYDKWQKLYKINNAISVIISHTIRSLQKLTERFLYGGQNRLELEKIKFELCMVEEIAEDLGETI